MRVVIGSSPQAVPTRHSGRGRFVKCEAYGSEEHVIKIRIGGKSTGVLLRS